MAAAEVEAVPVLVRMPLTCGTGWGGSPEDAKIAPESMKGDARGGRAEGGRGTGGGAATGRCWGAVGAALGAGGAAECPGKRV